MGPFDVVARHGGDPLKGRLDHGRSRVPAEWLLTWALVILHFNLNMDSVMMYATSLFHIGMQFILGTAWWIAMALRLVPLTLEARKNAYQDHQHKFPK